MGDWLKNLQDNLKEIWRLHRDIKGKLITEKSPRSTRDTPRDMGGTKRCGCLDKNRKRYFVH